jgi:MarR family transcriptional regulator, transcriptional regulator for hemolysin
MKVKPAARIWDPQAAPSFWINHASRLLLRHFERVLRPFGFGWAYVPVVIALEEHGALQQKELAELAHVEQPTMAALLARMERDELIVRTPHPADKRASLIALTRKAKARVPVAKEALARVADRVWVGFSAEEQRVFFALLQRAVANLEGWSPDEPEDLDDDPTT